MLKSTLGAQNSPLAINMLLNNKYIAHRLAFVADFTGVDYSAPRTQLQKFTSFNQFQFAALFFLIQHAFNMLKSCRTNVQSQKPSNNGYWHNRKTARTQQLWCTDTSRLQRGNFVLNIHAPEYQQYAEKQAKWKNALKNIGGSVQQKRENNVGRNFASSSIRQISGKPARQKNQQQNQRNSHRGLQNFARKITRQNQAGRHHVTGYQYK